MKRKDYMQPARDAMATTLGLTVGALGLTVARDVGAGLTGTTGTVFNQGVLPMAGMGMMMQAVPRVPRYRRKVRHRKRR